MSIVVIESKCYHNGKPSYSIQKMYSFYSIESAETFAAAVNGADQGSDPDNIVKAIIVDSAEQTVNGDAPHLLHTIHMNRKTRNIEYEAVEVFTRRNLEFQRSVGLNPAILHALDNPKIIAPAVLTETEREFHFLNNGEHETTDVYLSFLPDIRERLSNITSNEVKQNS